MIQATLYRSGHIQCDPCLPGTFALPTAGALSVSCTPCASGRFQPLPGQTACVLCAAGYFTSTNSSSFPLALSNSTSGAVPPMVGCEACPAGRYSARNESETCDECSSGSYALLPGQSRSVFFVVLRSQHARYVLLSCLACALGTLRVILPSASSDSVQFACEVECYPWQYTTHGADGAKKCLDCPDFGQIAFYSSFVCRFVCFAG